MNESILFDGIRKTKEYASMVSDATGLLSCGKKLPLLVNGLCDGAERALLYSLVKDLKEKSGKTVLILTGEERKANKLNEFFTSSSLKSAFYPVRDFNFYDMTSSHELEHERLGILSGIFSSSLDVVISTPEASMQYTIPRKELEARTFEVKKSDTFDISALCEKLIKTGYSPADMVESEGQYAVRGGIVDVFPTGGGFTVNGKRYDEHLPIRTELFGDEADRMEIFDPMTQRRVRDIDEFGITPSKEIIASTQDEEKITDILSSLLAKAQREETKRELEKELFSIKNHISKSFFDRFISLVYRDSECLLDYFSDAPFAIICDTASTKSRAKDSAELCEMRSKELIENMLITPEYAKYCAPVSEFERFLDDRITVSIDPFSVSHSGKAGGIYNFKTKRIAESERTLNNVCPELDELVKDGYSCALVCRTDAELKNCVKTLCELGIPAYDATGKAFDELEKGAVGVICDTFEEGYEIPKEKFAVMVLSSKSYSDVGRAVKKKSFAKSAGEKILSCADLNVGDYVVHASYGIGKYIGMENLCVCGAYRDYMAIQYAGTDKLYLPTDQLDLVAKYIGSGSLDGTVKLSRMGGADWKRSTEKAKTAAKDMAKELIELYARRQRINGFAFAKDGIMEREFDSSFEFDETECQKKAIDEIKSDMEKPYPMDRVLCGDVGYGKTEVAFRAAMKAVANGKQVAILVPTTILAMQHYQTALSRFAGTGVNIDMISRFRTPSQQAAVLRRLRRGDTDIIIGTHKLLNDRTQFKDLGLLIIDEEQRFGVLQKEKIKKEVPDVDVLSLSATPIPRTLSMAIGGIRDMSVLDEAPTGRVGVSSYVLEYDEGIINDAIMRELHRGGQVFYLYNNVEYIYTVFSRLKKTFPDAKIAVAHGQMDRESIEEIWNELVKGNIDILVSTTIVETGIDIPNANTLIIENADRMGLAQLHQIRGRVGRSHKRAYAYFTYRRGKEISEIAEKRLEAIRDFTEFGAGFKIAMRDLEIRGAGNLLGSAQHGHIDSVGYDMYVRLLNEAVLEEKGEKIEKSFETVISLSSDAYLPKSYIKASVQRIEMYKKIAHIQNEDDFCDVVSELTDRFGKLPRCAEVLVESSLVKAYASRAHMKKVEQLRAEMRFFPDETNLLVLAEIANLDRDKISVSGVGHIPYISLKITPGADFSKESVSLLKIYTEKSQKTV